jgi:TatD DNase family protein
MYVDVHTHLTHEKFGQDADLVIQRAVAQGLSAIVVNGLSHSHNRAVLELAKAHSVVKPALGIYPIDAVHPMLPETYSLPLEKFDVQGEIAFIRSEAKAGHLAAIGECGLDGHWLDDSTFKEQERVFEELIGIAMDCDIPAIIHTRKLEVRAMEILKSLGAKKVNFHCFGGRTKLAQWAAETCGWWFSIPTNATVSESFRKMLKTLPPEKILTETDAPYLAPVRGERNEPANVVGTVRLLADLRGMSEEDARRLIYNNYVALFGERWC